MKTLAFLISLTVLLGACSSHKSSNKTNEVCKKNWTPQSVDDNPQAQEKVDTSDNTKSIKVNEGEYTTPAVRVLYFDKSEDIKLDLTVHPTSVSKKSDSLNYTIHCVGGKGLRSNMDTLSIKIPYVSSMRVDRSGNTILSLSDISLEIASKANSQFIHFATASVEENKSESLKDVYPKNPDTKHVIYRINENAYESRIQLKSSSRKDSKPDERNLDIRAIISYQKKTAPKENSGSSRDEN